MITSIFNLDSFANCWKRYRKEQSASIAMIAAFVMPVVIGMVALGTDASLWMMQKRNLQISADAAVIAAGWELAQDNEDGMDAAAYREAQNNGFDPNANGDYAVNIVEYTEDGVRISVRLEQDAETFFSRIIMSEPIRTAAYAEALISETGGRFCILALEEDEPSSFRTHGAVDLYSPDCGIAVNSSDEEAMTMSGNVDVEVNSVRISGDYDIDGSVDFVYNTLTTGVAPLDDPYDDLEVPEFEGCDHNNKRVNKAATL